MTTPLLSGWTIAGDSLPERLQPHAPAAPAFRLPGADALSAFADLIGGDAPEEPAKPSHEGAPFPLPALMEADTPGCVTLRREISFAFEVNQNIVTFSFVVDEVCELTLSPFVNVLNSSVFGNEVLELFYQCIGSFFTLAYRKDQYYFV